MFTITIYQLNDQYSFKRPHSFAYLHDTLGLSQSNLYNFYDEVYKYTLDGEYEDDDEILSEVSVKFTKNIPSDFNGLRLDDSDIIRINNRFYIVDKYGPVRLREE